MKINPKKENNKLKKIITIVISTFLLVFFTCQSVFATSGESGISNIYIYVMFIIVTVVAVAEGVYIAYLKIFQFDKKDKKKWERKVSSLYYL